MITRIVTRTVLTMAILALLASAAAIAQESETHQVGEMTLTAEDAEKLFKAPGYSPYAGRNFPTQVYWGDTHLHCRCPAKLNGPLAPVGLCPTSCYPTPETGSTRFLGPRRVDSGTHSHQ